MLNISIVLYKPDWAGEVVPLLRELARVRCLNKIYLIDNSPEESTEFCPELHSVAQARCQAHTNNYCNTGKESGDVPLSDDKEDAGRIQGGCEGDDAAWREKVVYRFTGANIGYGRGHNCALRESVYDGVALHLVMNSDIVVKAEDIDTLCQFMESEPMVGQLMPHIVYPDGKTQYLCKLLPTPLDVFGRRFLPRRLMVRRNARYELRMFGYDRPLNVPYLSGCFMLLRTTAALEARLFDERYFMYPEDIDLTRTIHRNYLTLYYPAVTVVHNHKRESYHSLRLLGVHIVNLCLYFNKWGWVFDRERRAFNRQVLHDIAAMQQ